MFSEVKEFSLVQKAKLWKTASMRTSAAQMIDLSICDIPNSPIILFDSKTPIHFLSIEEVVIIQHSNICNSLRSDQHTGAHNPIDIIGTRYIRHGFTNSEVP